MSVPLQKLQRLWKNKKSVFSKDSEIIERVDRIYIILKKWDTDRDSILNINDYGRPSEEDIPTTDGWNAVKNRFMKFYDNHPELKSSASQVNDIEFVLHLKHRDGRFRVSSNARAESEYELDDTEPNNRCNPETHFGSHNYPFENIKFYLSCSGSEPFSKPDYFPESRFITKYIWMLANRQKIIPILSLRSFRELAPLFHELAKEVDWGDSNNHWNLSLSDFLKAWPDVSNQLCFGITGRNYYDLSEAEKIDLTKLLFIASISQTTTKNAFDMIQTGNNAIIFYGPPGTSKTYSALNLAMQLLSLQKIQNDEERPTDQNSDKVFEECNFTTVFPNLDEDTQKKYPELNHGCWEIVQFHPSYTYHDFIGGIMPDVDNQQLRYTKREGLFKRFCDAARSNPNYRFVFIIDEINRADLSSVFGELMYALEYRDNNVNTVQFGKFSIPRNVYIIGTMNTADKSLVTFDLALRRRFLFMKLPPDMNTLYDWNKSPSFPDSELEAFISSAEALNNSLITSERDGGLGLPEDYEIGQAYFMKIRDFCPDEEGSRHISPFARERLWDYHLQALIEEYLGAEAASRKAKIQEFRTRFIKQIDMVG